MVETGIQWVKRQLARGHGSRETMAPTESAATFERIDCSVLSRSECRRSSTLSTEPSLLPDFADTEAACTYSWAWVACRHDGDYR